MQSENACVHPESKRPPIYPKGTGDTGGFGFASYVRPSTYTKLEYGEVDFYLYNNQRTLAAPFAIPALLTVQYPAFEPATKVPFTLIESPVKIDIIREVGRLLSECEYVRGESNPLDEYLSSINIGSVIFDYLLELYTQDKEFRSPILHAVVQLVPGNSNLNGSLLELLKAGLSDASIRVRDAAVHTIEHFGTSGAELLRSHQERVPWLQEYISKVLAGY